MATVAQEYQLECFRVHLSGYFGPLAAASASSTSPAGKVDSQPDTLVVTKQRKPHRTEAVANDDRPWRRRGARLQREQENSSRDNENEVQLKEEPELAITALIKGVSISDSEHRRTGLAYDPRMRLHCGPINHPERPERITSIWEHLQSSSLVELCRRYEAREATADEILAVHLSDHYGKIERSAVDPDATVCATTDTYSNPQSFLAARLAAGSLIDLTIAVLKGEIQNGFAVVRPPGHHAEKDEAMGFCLFNNVAIAALAALNSGMASRVLIVDWDVHHGNGTQHIFEADPRVLFMSVHAFLKGKFFPGSGAIEEVGVGNGKGFTVNVPLDWFKNGDQDYLHIFKRIFLPIARQFNPDLVLVSCGFDAGLGDPLGKMKVSPEGFAHLLGMLMPLANGKLVLALEGGYNLSTIAYSAEACVRVLAGLSVDAPELDPATAAVPLKPETVRLVQDICDFQRRYWSDLPA